MKQQDYSNHGRWVLSYHLLTSLAILALLIGSIRNLIVSTEENLYPAVLLVLIAFILLFMFYFLRAFALKAQDRAIKVEENLRHYVLTGKLINSKLTMRQLIGLRFASDEEFPDLAEKAAKENLPEKEIKQLVKNWRADNYRV
jgi:hypothetical protein